MKLSFLVTATFVALASPSVISAQSRKPDVPASERPPAGMCRIWLDNVPAAQQPAPTDCATAVRNRPEKGRVIFGDDYVQQKRQDSARGSKPGINGFAPPADKKKNKRTPLLRLP
jgi:hypothetical protein